MGAMRCRTVGQSNLSCTVCGLYSLAVDDDGRCPRCVSGRPPAGPAELARHRARVEAGAEWAKLRRAR